ncbi:MAG TPA: type II toxin-antitoxin system RelE/ParE family toxin [Polyangium sp.]|nr:type II toxin-antitoxin system RelE/ParE family toxin [Polyangium sp.]
MAEKMLFWVGSSLLDTRTFPEQPKQRAGYQLFLVQQGHEPDDWKPMPAVAPGVREIRIHHQGEYRILYVATFPEGVYVLHSFQKKTQRTRQTDIEIARARYAAVLRTRTKR